MVYNDPGTLHFGRQTSNDIRVFRRGQAFDGQTGIRKFSNPCQTCRID